MAQKTIEEQIEELEAEESSLTAWILNVSGYRSISGAGTEGAKTEYTDPIKLRQLRNDVRERLAYLRLKQTQGYTV
jgi:hypothetical protein